MKRTPFLRCIYSSAFIAIAFISCEGLVKVPAPQNQLDVTTVFSDSASAAATVTSIYTYLNSSVHNSSKELALYSDDYGYTATVPNIMEYYQSQLSADNRSNASLWKALYFIVYQCNSTIENTNASKSLTKSLKLRLINEVKFLRAFAYFTLINRYDNIPMVASTDVDSNARIAQVSSEKVYSQIVKDLIDAKSNLSETYITEGKVRANRWAASALLARVYLFHKDWEKAEKIANDIIEAGIYSPLPAVQDVFYANSREAILQIWTETGRVEEAAQLIPATSTVRPTYIISQSLFSSFDDEDNRKNEWIGTNTVVENDRSVEYYYPYKYKNRVSIIEQPEFVMALRLSEQYLIRAEARAYLNDFQGAIEDINVIRERADIQPLSYDLSQEQILDAVSMERRKEFFGEWGMRFMDLKRAGRLKEVLGTLKDTWREGTAERLPIPHQEIVYNNNLIQNHGY